MTVPQVNIFGAGWQRAAKEHTCWLWNAQESTAIPIAHIREWKIKPVQPAQGDAA